MQCCCRGLASAILLSGILLQTGCQMGGRHFQYDSGSRMPWFGLNLKSDAPERTIRPIQAQSGDALNIESAELVQLEPERNDDAQRRPRIPLPRTDLEDAEPQTIDVASTPDDDGWF